MDLFFCRKKWSSLECLKYAREKGCPWDDWTCSSAASGGHFECLKYAHDNGCPGSAYYVRNRRIYRFDEQGNKVEEALFE